MNGIGLETLRIVPDACGIPVDARMRVGGNLWAIGDVTGLWPLTHVGWYHAGIVAANILGEPREAHYDAVPRVTFTHPQAAAVGATEDSFGATVRLSDIAKTATFMRARGVRRLPHPAQRRQAADRRARARPGSG